MSSHHVIREKQEPALLVLGLDNFADELLGQLLEWSPTVITIPETAEKLNMLGIKIDWIVGSEIMSVLQSDVRQLDLENETPVRAALKFLTDEGYPSVNVVTDELTLLDYLPFIARINLVIFYDHKKIFAVNSGFSKWKPSGEEVELLSPVNRLKVEGLEPIDHQRYKTTHDGFYSLSFDEPFIFIGEGL
jgi:thiamine pyrophosphokinase